MGLLSGFLGGAFGQGLQQAAANSMRRDELEAARQERASEKEADRQMREQLMREQLMARYGSDGSTPGTIGGNAASRGAKVALSEQDIGALARDIVGRDKGLSDPEIDQLQEAARTGVNPYNKPGGVPPSEIMDPRDAQARGGSSEPDEAKFRELLGSWRKALVQARTSGPNADDFAKAERTRQQVETTDAAAKDPSRADVLAKAVSAGDGKEQYKVEGNTRLDTHTGDMKTTEVGQSVITENKAQAGKAAADAAKAGKDGTGALINGYRDAMRESGDRLDRATSAVSKAEGDVAKAKTKDAREQAQAALAEARRREQTAREAYEADSSRHAQAVSGLDKGKTGASQVVDVSAERKRASDAIARGADPVAVKKRFKERTGKDL